MTTVRGETKIYFLCTGRTHKKTCKGVKQTLYVSDMEDMIDECIKKKLNSLKLSRVKHSEDGMAQINALKLKIKEIDEQMMKLSDAILSGLLNNDMVQVLNAKAKSLSNEKRVLTDRIDELVVSNSNVCESMNFAKKWSKADFKEKRAICNVLIKTIIIYEDASFEIVWNI